MKREIIGFYYYARAAGPARGAGADRHADRGARTRAPRGGGRGGGARRRRRDPRRRARRHGVWRVGGVPAVSPSRMLGLLHPCAIRSRPGCAALHRGRPGRAGHGRPARPPAHRPLRCICTAPWLLTPAILHSQATFTRDPPTSPQCHLDASGAPRLPPREPHQPARRQAVRRPPVASTQPP